MLAQPCAQEKTCKSYQYAYLSLEFPGGQICTTLLNMDSWLKCHGRHPRCPDASGHRAILPGHGPTVEGRELRGFPGRGAKENGRARLPAEQPRCHSHPPGTLPPRLVSRALRPAQVYWCVGVHMCCGGMQVRESDKGKSRHKRCSHLLGPWTNHLK